jgi:spore maturation protein CgeB
MNLVVFGLTVSSSWGNGHATLWRGLIRGLASLGHRVTFFERDVPYYAAHRDLHELPGCKLVLYPGWSEVLPVARSELRAADVAIVTSYCADGVPATELALSSNVPLSVFYDMDTPVTLQQVRTGRPVAYLGPAGLSGFDLVLSYTGGRAIEELCFTLGARHAVPLYGSADPAAHSPCAPSAEYRADLSYLGTYAADRQPALEELFLAPARRRRDLRFLIGGSQYPPGFPWAENLWYRPHVAPAEHPAFYGSSPLTLNITRAAMAQMGFCPSGRLFEAALCGTPVISDAWQGLDLFFEPGREILVAETADDVLAALDRPREELAAMGRRARDRVLAEHTSLRRAAELVAILEREAPSRAYAPAAEGRP